MTEKLFFSQELIDSWCDDDRVKFENDTLSMGTAQGMKEYVLNQACRVLQVSDGGADPHGVLDKIFTMEEFAEKNADVYLDSCIIGDTPYDLEQGYVATKAEDEQTLDEMLMEYLAKTLI